MIRFVFAVIIATLIFAVVTRERVVWRLFFAMLGIVLAYLVLKFTGVIDALQPSR